jgi:dihydrofolate reductase
MRKILMIMFMTLDGQAQFPIYPPDPNADPDEDPMWQPRMDSIDTIILGRKAYLKWAAFWPKRQDDPSAGEWSRGFSRFANSLQKIVFSNTLERADWGPSRIVRGSPADEVKRMQSEKGLDIAIGGGPRIAQAFLEADLVDEMLLDVFPSIVGHGKPLFPTADDPDYDEDRIPIGAAGRHDFRLKASQPLSDGSLFLHFEKKIPK